METTEIIRGLVSGYTIHFNQRANDENQTTNPNPKT